MWGYERGGAEGKAVEASAAELGHRQQAEEREPRLSAQRGLPAPAALHPLAFGPSPDSEFAFLLDAQFERPCIGALQNMLAGREGLEK